MSENAVTPPPTAAADSLEWHAVPIGLPPEGSTAAFTLGERALLLCNAEGAPYVVTNDCPHMRAELTGGALRGTVLECPLHGGKFDVRDGSAVALPIRRPATCHPVRQSDAGLQVGIRSS